MLRINTAMSRKIAAFIRGRSLIVFLLVPAAFIQGQHLIEGGIIQIITVTMKRDSKTQEFGQKRVTRHMVFEGPRFAIPSILYSPLTAASVFTPISLARSSALIEVYALETRSKALFFSFSETEGKKCQTD